MKFALYTNLVSPHTVPLAAELRKLFGEFSYIYQNHGGEPLRTESALVPIQDCAVCAADYPVEAKHILHNCDVLLTGVRDFDLMQKRTELGLLTIYQSERWFKPVCLTAISDSENARSGIWVSGFLKNLLPFAIRRAFRMIKLLRSKHFMYLPIGIHAAKDMARMCGLFSGDWRCLFRAPRVDFERRAGGRVWMSNCSASQRRYCLDRMRMWGYYVSQSNANLTVRKPQPLDASQVVRVLWVGRFLSLKRVDVIIKAVAECTKLRCSRGMHLPEIRLDIYGEGPEETRLKEMSFRCAETIQFFPPVPIAEVRRIMRGHDVFVLSSNAFEGWGAVVNEAIEEGMCVFGTYEAGASATILSERFLFHSGDWKRLRDLLIESAELSKWVNGIGSWSAEEAARTLAKVVAEVRK